jgi:hypothetical protein
MGFRSLRWILSICYGKAERGRASTGSYSARKRYVTNQGRRSDAILDAIIVEVRGRRYQHGAM